MINNRNFVVAFKYKFFVKLEGTNSKTSREMANRRRLINHNDRFLNSSRFITTTIIVHYFQQPHYFFCFFY